MPETKPTVNSVTDERQQWDMYYGEMRRRFLSCQAAYEGDIKCVVEEGYEKYVPPTASSLVDTEVDHIITRHPVVTVPPLKDSQKGQETADKLEKFAHAVLESNAKSSAMQPIKTAAKDAAIYGMFCIKGPVYQPLSEDKKYFRRDFPIVFRTINPTFILPSPSMFWEGDGPVIEVKKKRVGEVKLVWPEANFTPLEGKGDMDEVEIIERWSWDWKVYLSEGQILEAVPNIYGYVPYEIGFSGLGRQGEKPEDMAVGLLWRVISALEIEARTASAIDAIVLTHAYPKLVADIPPEQLNLHEGPGGISFKPPGSKIELLYEYKVPPFVYQHLGNIREDLTRGTYSEVVRGENPAGVTSGYHQRLLVSEARLKFGDVRDNLQFKVSNVLAKAAWMIEQVIGEPVSIWGKLRGKHYEETIKPEDVQGHYVFDVDLSETSPEEADRLAMTGFQMFKGGGITEKRYWEKYLRISDYWGEKKQQFLEKALNSQVVEQAMSQAAAEEWGLNEYIAKIQQQAQAAAGQPPPVMTPGLGAPPVAPPAPGSAEEMDLMLRQQIRPGMPQEAPLAERGQFLGL